MSLNNAYGSERKSGFVAGCKAQKMQLFAGPCPHCGQELEFFTMAEMKNQRYCYHCKGKFDPVKFAADLGLSI